ncbi:MAG: mechanosensitive ion channel domain-containing protein [Candidatus Nanohaloarchaea archaeon]
MLESLSSALNLMLSQEALPKTFATILILVFGYITVRTVLNLVRNFWIDKNQELSKKQVEDRYEITRYISHILNAGIVLIALLYLNTALTSSFTTVIAEAFPELLSALLIGALGIITINLATNLISEFIKSMGGEKYLWDIGLSRNSAEILNAGIKAFLYLILIQVILTHVGIGNTFINEIITASTWAGAFLIAAITFYSTKDLFLNAAASLYLKSSNAFKPGEEVVFKGREATIKDTSIFNTLLSDETGFQVMTPNKKLMEKQIRFKRAETDVELLENIVEYFSKQGEETEATVEMALEALGQRASEESIEEALEEQEPASAIQEVSENQLETLTVEGDQVGKLGDEFKAWLNGDALIVLQEEQLFGKESLSVVVGFEENEAVVLKIGESRGVYLIDSERLKNALKDSNFVVAADENSRSGWRIKNELPYVDPESYEELSKTLESRLKRMERQARILDEVKPDSFLQYMEKWKRE